MAAEEDKSNDFYAVLGLRKECSAPELKKAYRKLAMKWHPDRLSASGTQKCMEEANKRFQEIQQAYSVLADANKRFLYDVGAYDCNDDEDENGMGDFLSEMSEMMNRNKSHDNENENENDRFEELHELFVGMLQDERASCTDESESSCTASFATPNNKREDSCCNGSAAGAGAVTGTPHLPMFCIGSFQGGRESSRKQSSKKGRR